MQSALLWYRMLKESLEEDGFVVNPYDPCVANKTYEDGTQCTICWYVDDLKISHIRESIVDEVISKLEARYGKMKVHKGKNHQYLGMDILYRENGDVELKMKEYLWEAINLFPEEISKGSTTPASTYLFETREEAPKLLEKK